MRLQPRFAHAHFHFDRNLQVDRVLHFVFDDGSHGFLFWFVKIKDELVVDLEQHARFEFPGVQFLVDVHGSGG